MSALRLASSAAKSSRRATCNSTSMSLWRWLKALSSGPAANSAKGGVAATRTVVFSPSAALIARRASSSRSRMLLAALASRRPPGVSSITPPARTYSGSPSSRRKAPTAPDIAGSDTSRARAAALTVPSRATVKKLRS